MPEDIYAVSSRIVDDAANLQPAEATFAGIAGHDARWDDFSSRGAEERRAMLRSAAARVEAVGEGSGWSQLALSVARDYIDRELSTFEDDDHLRDLNNLASPFQTLTRVFDVMNTETEAGWRNIASRLETLDAAAESYRARLEEGRNRNRTAARRQVEAVIEQGRALGVERSSLGRLPAAVTASGVAGEDLAARVEAGVARARAAMSSLTDYLERDYLPAAASKDAVGEERYTRCARRFLGTELNAPETYRWGWSEVARLRTEMLEVARRRMRFSSSNTRTLSPSRSAERGMTTTSSTVTP